MARTLAKIPGIGPAKASRTLHKLSWHGFTRLVEGAEPKELAAECPGIGPSTAKKIIDYWVQYEGDAPEESGIAKDGLGIIRALGIKLDREVFEDALGYSLSTAEELAEKYLELYREKEE
jgi:Holliday junction resolvasome RuvABC DNA-binding subunit